MTIEEQVQHYSPSKAAIDLVRRTNIILLAGISGAGKDTIMHHLLARDKYHYIVSHTTRPPRINHGVMETNGVEYHFIDLHTAETMLKNKAYIEANYYSGHVYGTSVAEIQLAHDEGKAAITDMEVQGVHEYTLLAPEAVKPIFILPPNYATWQKRLNKRYGAHIEGHKDDLAKRIATSKLELQYALDNNYYHFVINDDITQAVKDVDTIVWSKEGVDTASEAVGRALARKLLAEVTARY